MPHRPKLIPVLKEWTDSCFYKELLKHENDKEIAKLLVNIRILVEQADKISEKVVENFPHYTNHGALHLKNVLSYMSWIAEPTISDWHPVECGLAIVAAYVHDLGMVPTETERRFLDEDISPVKAATADYKRRAWAWTCFREVDPLWLLYKRDTTSAKPAFKKLAVANFLRSTHASTTYTDGIARIKEHLEEIVNATDGGKGFFVVNGFNWLPGLVLLCLSHNQDIRFIENNLSSGRIYEDLKEANEQRLSSHGVHEIHWPRISWALRLADVIDMDASRTPAILLHTIKEEKSWLEWKKHYCIGSFKVRGSPDGSSTQLVYYVGECPDAQTEHALREMVGFSDGNQRIFSTGWINEELQNVRAAQERFGSIRQKLRLPDVAYAEITQRRGGYIYEELLFKLNREAVMGLLMGEALYGSPDFCLRELVQNALDAVHLRDVYWQWHMKNNALPRAERLREVPKVETTEGQRLGVEVSWGFDSGRDLHYLEVRDNGVGMSSETFKKYLTQVGQSFYSSPKFREHSFEMLDVHKLLCTPISQFGIGFLAVFMMTDHVEILTRTHEPDQHWKVEICGPYSFMKLTKLGDEGPERTGTWVKIWLKGDFQFEPFDWPTLVQRLRSYFYDSDEPLRQPSAGTIEPAWAIARSIVWPLHPVVLIPPSLKGVPPEFSGGIVIDEKFHSRYLLPCPDLQPKQDFPWLCSERLTRFWHHHDWTHSSDTAVEDQPPTGTRVRVSMLATEGSYRETQDTTAGPQGPSLAAELVEVHPTLPRRRALVLINGIYIDEGHKLLPWLNIAPGFGSVVWLDLRGRASLRLRADRKGIVENQDSAPSVANHVQSLWFEQWASDKDWKRTAICPPSVDPNQTFVDWRPHASHRQKGWSWPRFVSDAMLTEHLIEPPFHSSPKLLGPHSVVRDDTFSFEIVKRLTESKIPPDEPPRPCQYYLATFVELLNGDPEIRRYLTAHSLIDLVPNHQHWDVFVKSTSIRQKSDKPHLVSWDRFVTTLFFPEAFRHSEDGLPSPLLDTPLAFQDQPLTLSGPLHPQSVTLQTASLPFDHDLVAPMTNIPLNAFHSCGYWRLRRVWRLLFLLPFYLGCVPPFWKGKEPVIQKALAEVSSLSLYIPDEDCLYNDWSSENWTREWKKKGITLLWDIPNGSLLWRHGSATRQELQTQGTPLFAP